MVEFEKELVRLPPGRITMPRPTIDLYYCLKHRRFPYCLLPHAWTNNCISSNKFLCRSKENNLVKNQLQIYTENAARAALISPLPNKLHQKVYVIHCYKQQCTFRVNSSLSREIKKLFQAKHRWQPLISSIQNLYILKGKQAPWELFLPKYK